MKKISELKKCHFCDQKEDGGVDILESKANLGELGTLEAGITMWDYRESSYPPSLHIWMWLKTGECSGEQLGAEKRVGIKYCPFCGRRIEKIQEEKRC